MELCRLVLSSCYVVYQVAEDISEVIKYNHLIGLTFIVDFGTIYRVYERIFPDLLTVEPKF